MAFGESKIFSFAMTATGGTATVAHSIGFQKVFLVIPSMVSATALDVYGAGRVGGTKYQLRKPVAATTTAQFWTFTIAASCGANGGVVELPAGFPTYKFVATDSAPTTTLNFELVCAG